jgi:hypothetical protein
MASTTDATVTDYSTGDTLEGAASDALVLASLRAHPEGAVRASLRGGEWVPDEAGTHTVYTEGYSAFDGATIDRVKVSPAGVADVAGDCDPEGAYWVSARVDVLGDVRTVRVFACRRGDGQPGLEACGDSLDDWCDAALVSAYGGEAAAEIGREVIASGARRV